MLLKRIDSEHRISDSTIQKRTDAMDKGQLASLRHAVHSMVKANARTGASGELTSLKDKGLNSSFYLALIVSTEIQSEQRNS